MPQGEYLQYGGQAIIEGVMMRSPRYFAVACRAPNGEIVLRTEEIEKTWVGRQKWLKRPFLRGTLALLDAMALGIKAMKFASNVQLDAAYQPEGGIPRQVPTKQQRINSVVIGGCWAALLAIGAVFAPGLVTRRYSATMGQNAELLGYAAAGVLAILALASLFGVIGRARMIGLSDDDWLAAQKPDVAPSGRVQDFAVGATIVVSLLMGFAIFQYSPNLISQNLQRVGWGGTAINLATELIKITFFIGYIWLISQMKEIQEVFKYHGAEHKAINTMEAGLPLTMENCKQQTRLHPRCGTSFAIVVLLVGLVIFTLLPRYPFGRDLGIIANASVRFLVELPLLFPIAGISYELIRFAGKFKDQRFVRALFWPGLMTQYLTTREPEEKHIEVALDSLDAVVKAEAGMGVEAKSVEVPDEPAAQIA